MWPFSKKKPLPLTERFDAVALKDAVLCVNCSIITAARNGHCPACQSPSLCNLSNILDGEENGALSMMRAKNKPRRTRIFEIVPRRP